MHSVVIVDDEPTILEGLKTLIPWNEQGFDVIAVAKNGVEGIQLYRQLTPDLMIVDIRMPQMDGLTMMKEIRLQSPNVHFLILSGYADFDYAKQAIKSGADGYLLKPLDEDELIQSLHIIKVKLKQMQVLEQMKEHNKEKTRHRLIKLLLTNDLILDESEIVHFQEHFGLINAEFQIILLKEIESRNDMQRQSSEWKLKLKAIYEISKRGYVFERQDVLGLLLFNENSNKIQTSTMFKEISEVIETERFYAVVGDEVDQLKNISQSFETALQLMDRRFYFEIGKILNKYEHAILQYSPDNIVNDFQKNEIEDKLYYSLEIADYKMCKKIIDEFVKEVKVRLLSKEEIITLSIQIYTGSLSKVMTANPSYKPFINSILAKSADIYEMDSLPSIRSFLLEQTKNVVQFLDNGKTDIIVNKMIDLINKSYAQNIRLETLAEVFNYNSAYLGKLFRSSTGVYFNTYLDQVRIEKGKGLLKKGLKVYEVAEQIGYANVDYFHKKFKFYTGFSPSRFRKEVESINEKL
ncbi:response regulator transcription factor [Bacillus sp. FSL K6-3431]|uniref:response regulator transcription factor n=1 Tax=Bacillus sp. FSL K6-3431 TaxID=2921500 RepID=UPI0030FAA27B